MQTASPGQDQEGGDEALWIGRQGIEAIADALQPAAYVARAYWHQRRHDGQLPDWARKGSDGQWLFAATYIRADALENARTIHVSDAARRLGATRRAVQTWVDEGIVASLAETRGEGEPRRIDRAAFERDFSRLRERLRTAPPVAPREVPAVVPAVLPAAGGHAPAALKHELESLVRQRRQGEREAEAARRRALTQTAAVARLEEECRRIEAEAADRMRALEAARQMAEGAALRVAGQERALAEVRQREAALEHEWRAAVRQPAAARLRGAAPVAPEVSAGGADHARRTRSAASVAERFRKARDERAQVDRWQQEGARIAARIVADVDAGKLERVDGAILFNDVARRAGVPDTVRVALMRTHFKKNRAWEGMESS